MDPVLYRNEFGHARLRRSILAAFFVRRPIAEVGDAFQRLFEAWLAFVPEEAKKWCSIGPHSEDSKPFATSMIKRCKAELDPLRAAKRELGSFEILGPENSASEYEFRVKVSSRVNGVYTSCQVAEFVFPLSFGEPPANDGLIAFLKGATAELPVDSGYLAPALSFPSKRDLSGARAMIAPLAMRHPGYDVPDNTSSSKKVGGLCRGARWITILGPDQVATLGTMEPLANVPGIAISSWGGGSMIRAGERAEIGDVNAGERLPLLRAVARHIQPISLFDDIYLDSVLGMYREAWERRFLD